ncbi:MAG TPA: hypothetical protein VEW65_13700, partial [Chryseolinea sp.]|nr:hypothetical protein [Chryseolinea sp.]
MKHKIQILKTTPVIIILVMFCTGMTVAQQPVSYSLKDILKVAVENNNNVVKAKYDYEEGLAKTKEVKSAALPQVN